MAVAYEKTFHVGRVESFTDDMARINFLNKSDRGHYKWPARDLIENVDPIFIFALPEYKAVDSQRILLLDLTFLKSNYAEYKQTFM